MPLTREERKLLHQKSKQPTFGVNKPDAREGHEGDIAYRRVEGSGTVQYVKENGDWTAIASSGKMPKSRNIITSSSLTSTGLVNHNDLAGLGSDDHTQYLLVSGTRAMTGNLDMGTNNIGSVGALDVDGHTTLDQVTINTADGAFAVSGANNIELTTTDTNDLNFNISGTCNWDTSTTDWDNSGTFTLTSTDNLTIETSGADTAKTITILNDNTNASAFSGIHIKTNGQNIASCYNGILIECDGIAAKGSSYGIDLRSENNILIRGEDANGNNSHPSTMKICSTGNIDIGAGFESSAITIGTTVTRTQIHGVFETSNLWRNSDAVIFMDRGYITDPDTPTGLYTKFEAIDTYKLIRAMTFKASAEVKGTNIGADHVSHISYSGTDPYDGTDGTLRIVPPSGTGINHDDNLLGTVWKVTVFFHYGSGNPNLQVYWCYASSSSTLKKVRIVNDLDSGTSPVPDLTWDSTDGIYWTNEEHSDATVRASALRVQSGTFDF